MNNSNYFFKDLLRPWISQKITQMMNLEDDVVHEYVINQLEQDKYPDPKKIQ